MADESKDARGERGRFKKGKSGNPKGRPPLTAPIRAFMDVGHKAGKEEFATRWEAVISALFKTATDRNCRDHVRAAETLLSYAPDRPVQRVELSGPGDPNDPEGNPGPIQVAAVAMTSGAVRRQLEEVRAERERLIRGSRGDEAETVGDDK